MPLEKITKNTLSLVLILLFTLCKPAAAQQTPPAHKPEDYGISSDRLNQVQHAMERHISNNNIAGAVTLVARQGNVIHFEAYGHANKEAEKPMRKETLFVLASMTKPVTGAAVMMLIEEAKIHLDDPVSKFIPEFKDMKVALQNDSSGVRLVEANREITVGDLLTHTSGLGTGGIGMQNGPEMQWPAESGITLANYVPDWADIPLDFQPGSRWGYSPHAGMDILARIVEVTSGKPFNEFLKDRLFEPLGMNSTYFNLPKEQEIQLAAIYEKTEEGLMKADNNVIPLAKTYFSGSIGLISTAKDYFRFAQMLLNQGAWKGEQILSPRAVRFFSANHVGDMMEGQLGRSEGIGFGLSVETVEDAIEAGTFRSKGSYGWDGYYGTYFSIDPKEQLVSVLMIHTSVSVSGKIQNDFDTAVMQTLID